MKLSPPACRPAAKAAKLLRKVLPAFTDWQPSKFSNFSRPLARREYPGDLVDERTTL